MKLADRIRQASPAQRSLDVCFKSGLLAELEDLAQQLTETQNRRGDRLNRGRDERDLAQRIEALREEMAQATVTFHLQVLPRGRWRELLAENPPRPGDKRDEEAGTNVDAFNIALLRESVVAPDLDDDDWEALLAPDGLSEPQFDEFIAVAWQLNTRTYSVPFSSAASKLTQNFEPGSRQPDTSASPSSASTGGSRPRSTPRTTTTRQGGSRTPSSSARRSGTTSSKAG